MVLHLTNGESAGQTLSASGLDGEVVCWNDVLHDGPVPGGLTLDELSQVRAEYISGCGWGTAKSVAASFDRRNDRLRQAKTFAEVILWFEHDLYDQLQLIQILDYFASTGMGWTVVTLLQTDVYLGTLSPNQMVALYPARRKVTREQFLLAREAWSAFRQSTPAVLETLFAIRPPLPFLGPALRRFAEEYPWTTDGLGRTERFILHTLAGGVHDREELFRRYNGSEEPAWMGDSSFFLRLDRLSGGCRPLVKNADLGLTPKGEAVLRGEDDRIRDNGIDLWLGGVHLIGNDSPWRWDPTQERFVSRPADTH